MGSNASLSQGVQQAFEISVLTSIEKESGIHLSLIAYPNPTLNYLNLEVNGSEFPALHFHLLEMSGKLIISDKINSNSTMIDMDHLSSGTYFLKIYSGLGTDVLQEIKTFKIVKL